ncbi:uncharacterized protein LOC135142734 [Zophobas morio]|uniref:uncharacterized protein LOC135142734 n=1 Tax=Zophobas morio TaxID=2755281 RepID=UPI0030827167
MNDQAHRTKVPVYANKIMSASIPYYEIPEDSMAPRIAHQVIIDEMNLDGNPMLNMASFVCTYMDEYGEDLILKGSRKNFIDLDEYAITYSMQMRCVNMIARLFNAPLSAKEEATGTSCIGSSEAIMLAGLALKWKWRERRRKAGLSYDKPNLVMGSNVQVCWHKFCMYFDVERRESPMSTDCLVLTPERAKPLLDENTIGICIILGSTYNGEFEDVKGIHEMLEEYNKEHNLEIPIHVDAASGGFIAPFLNPDLVWDFRLPLVKSINTSGHKFGLVYPGVGWALWRERKDLPDDLIFHVNYLGGDQATFTFNFSKPAGQIVAQYYQLIRLGKSGYRSILETGMKNAEYLRDGLREMGLFDIVDKAHMPLVAFSLKDNHAKYSLFDVQDRLKACGWIVPAYRCPIESKEFIVSRVVVKQNMTRHMCDMLIKDVKNAISSLEEETKLMGPTPTSTAYTDEKAHHFWQLISKAIVKGDIGHRFRAERTHGVC